MALHFISDLHLDPQRPGISALFLGYLRGPARQATALYILGDLFEYWVDDVTSIPMYTPEISALADLAASGTRIYYMAGNRDFMCGQDFARAAGLQLIDDPSFILDGSVSLMHGDALCTDDHAYQRFRRIVRRPWLQAVFRALPKGIKQRIAARVRGESKLRTRLKPEQIMDVNGQAVQTHFEAHPGTRLLIHGHTHRPADHHCGDHGHRLVLADWSERRGEYLILESETWQRHALCATA